MKTRSKLYLAGAVLVSAICAPSVALLAGALTKVGWIGGWLALGAMYYLGVYVGVRTEQERNK